MRSLKNLQAALGAGAVSVSMLLAGTAHAASFDSTSTIQTKGSGDFSGNDWSSIFTQLANNALNIILGIAGVIAVFYLIWAGFQYVTAAGNAEKTKAARTGIINAVIGLVIIIGAFVIVQLATNAAGAVTDTTSATTT